MRMAQADRVLFVVPTGLNLSAVELRVLRRDAVAAQVGVALVTTDVALRALLRAEASAHFAVSGAVNGRAGGGCVVIGSRARGGRRSRAHGATRGGAVRQTIASGFRPVAFLRAYVRRRNPWWAVLGLTLALLMIFGGMLYALTYILPSATITVAPASETLRVNIPLKAVQDARLGCRGGCRSGPGAERPGRGRCAHTDHGAE